MVRKRIVLLHATQVSFEPIHSAFDRLWPEAELVNLLDDALTLDRSRASELSPDLIERFLELARYGFRLGADGILVTCSAFGPAIERAAAELPVPVLKPNQAMFEAALTHGERIGMLSTFFPSTASMENEFIEAAAQSGSQARLTAIDVPEAIDSLRRGDVATHNRILSEYALQLTNMDAVMLAQFSASRAAEAVRCVIGCPVLTAPEAAVLKMRSAVLGAG